MSKHHDRKLRPFVVAGSVLLTMVLGGLDFLAHPGLSFLLLYLFPLVLAAWFGGFGAGLLVTVVAAAAWYGNDWLATNPHTDLWIFLWFLVTRVLLFVFVAWILSRLAGSLRALKSLAQKDALMGLLARSPFFVAAETELSRARRYKHPFSLALLDIDGLRSLNKSSGHKAGDRVLAEFGKTVRENVRKSDVAARFGDDEAAVWLPETRFEPAAVWIDRLRKGLAGLGAPDGLTVSVTVVAVTFRSLPATADEVLSTVQSLMAEAKKEGPGTLRHAVWGTDAASGPGLSKPPA
jgi:diguanylate cyclase (GGDEF)-like protein